MMGQGASNAMLIRSSAASPPIRRASVECLTRIPQSQPGRLQVHVPHPGSGEERAAHAGAHGQLDKDLAFVGLASVGFVTCTG